MTEPVRPDDDQRPRRDRSVALTDPDDLDLDDEEVDDDRKTRADDRNVANSVAFLISIFYYRRVTWFLPSPKRLPSNVFLVRADVDDRVKG